MILCVFCSFNAIAFYLDIAGKFPTMKEESCSSSRMLTCIADMLAKEGH